MINLLIILFFIFMVVLILKPNSLLYILKNHKKFKWSIQIALIYLLTIATFAFIYTLNSKDFYHTTTKYETLTRNLKNKIRLELKQGIIDNFKKLYNKNEINLGSKNRWILDIENIEVYDLKVDDNNKSFKLFLPMSRFSDENSQTWANRVIEVEIDRSGVWNGIKGTSEYYRIMLNLGYDENVIDYDMGKINYIKIFTRKVVSNRKTDFIIKASTYNDMLIYDDALNGFPHGTADNWQRMLYLSMVTITSLGYGDIVPLTNEMRILVGLQSMLGIILLAIFVPIFLNEFSKRNREVVKSH